MTKPKTKRFHRGIEITATRGAIEDGYNEGYAQALVDEINFLETLHPEFYTSCKCGCFNGERTTCIIHQIKQRIQALKNHSPENPNTTREGVKSGGVSRINPTLLPENALNHSQDSPSGDLCQCGHEKFLHFINQRKGKCGYSENNVTHDCDCKQFTLKEQAK